MKLTHDELEFLSAWAREEWEPACYRLPSHRLQLAHAVSGAQLLVFIKVWTEGEGKKDLDIRGAAANPRPRWPWPTAEDFGARFAEASRWWTQRQGMTSPSGAGGSLIDDLLASNPKFQALVAKSKAGSRKPFAAGEQGSTNG